MAPIIAENILWLLVQTEKEKYSIEWLVVKDIAGCNDCILLPEIIFAAEKEISGGKGRSSYYWETNITWVSKKIEEEKILGKN